MQTNYKAAPNDSRYIPFTQQDYCCVPTSIQMIMYRHDIPLIPAEELGYHLGLTVPTEQADIFYAARTADTPPATSGFGTQMGDPSYGPNGVFQKLGIPLSFSKTAISEITSEANLMDRLRQVETEDGDALLCFNHGVVRGEYQPNAGHVVVFDRIIDGQIRIVDASWKNPKWRFIDIPLLLDAMQKHGDNNMAGIWHFQKT